MIEEYQIFKKYPSSIEIQIVKTNFLANVFDNNKNFLLGSNGRLIDTKERINQLPNIYGKFINKEFFDLKKIIDRSNFSYDKIKNFFYFPSGRWDIELDSELLIKLPKDNLEGTVNLFIDILGNEKFKDSKILDLRQKDKVVING